MQVQSTEQEYVRLVQEIFFKNMHFSEFDELQAECLSQDEKEADKLDSMS